MGVSMSEYRVERRWLGKGLASVFGVMVALWTLLGVSYEGKWGRNLMACGPAIVLASYGIAALWRNKTSIIVGRDGVWVRRGPLPLLESARFLPREEIVAVQVRNFVDHGKYGGRFRTVGVEMRDGTTLAVVSSCPPDPGMEEEARKIAVALGWMEAVSVLNVRGRTRIRWGAWWPVLRFLILVAFCLWWGNRVMGGS